MELKSLLQHLQVSVTCPYPEPDQSSPCPPPPQPASWLSILIQGAAEITPTFWRSIKIKRNKVHKKIILFIKSTYDAIFFQIPLKITSLKCRPLLMTNPWSRSRKLSMALRVIASGMTPKAMDNLSERLQECVINNGRHLSDVIFKSV